MDVHPSATIWPKVKIGKNVKIWPDVVIKWTTIIGDGCELLEGAYVNSSHLGDNTIIGVSAKIDTSQIGSKCKIYCKVTGSKIGNKIELPHPSRIVKDSDIGEGTLHIG